MLCANLTAFQNRVANEPVICSVVLRVNDTARSLDTLPSDPQERMTSVKAFFREVMSSPPSSTTTVGRAFLTGNQDATVTVPVGSRTFGLNATGLDSNGETLIFGVWQIAVMTREALEKR